MYTCVDINGDTIESVEFFKYMRVNNELTLEFKVRMQKACEKDRKVVDVCFNIEYLQKH